MSLSISLDHTPPYQPPIAPLPPTGERSELLKGRLIVIAIIFLVVVVIALIVLICRRCRGAKSDTIDNAHPPPPSFSLSNTPTTTKQYAEHFCLFYITIFALTPEKKILRTELLRIHDQPDSESFTYISQLMVFHLVAYPLLEIPISEDKKENIDSDSKRPIKDVLQEKITDLRNQFQNLTGEEKARVTELFLERVTLNLEGSPSHDENPKTTENQGVSDDPAIHGTLIGDIRALASSGPFPRVIATQFRAIEAALKNLPSTETKEV